MDKILGEVFDEYVDKQIKVRQKSLGKSQKSPDDLVVFNSSTPWIRLSSSVEVDKDRAKTLATNLGINQSEIVGNNLARNLILFAGTSDGANLSNRKGGVGYGLESSYGFLSDKEQGYRPMPGITSISATYKNNGTLKQAQVNLKCFTRKQFEAIEAIYLRLGYTMLLEWGHSLYFDNKGIKQNMSALKIPNILFKRNSSNSNTIALAAVEEALKINPNLTSNQKDAIYFEEERKARNYPTRLRAALQENKEKTGGNYDAMMAKVQNFSWSLNNDLSYSITLNLVSVGDIVDSLKMNFGGTQLTRTDTSQLVLDGAAQNLATIELNSGASAFNSFLNELTQFLQSPEAQESLDVISQEQIQLKNEAVKIFTELVPAIQETYPPLIDELTKKYITSYKNVQNLLNDQAIDLQYGSYGAEIIISPELDAKIQAALKDNGFKELESLTSSTEFDSTRYTQRFFTQFDIDIAVSSDDRTKATLKIDTENKFTDSQLTIGVKELEKQLGKVKAQVERVILNAKVANPDENNLALFKYLGDNKDRAKKVILNGLLEGFYDAPEKNIPSDIELSDYWLGDTIIRKWITSTS